MALEFISIYIPAPYEAELLASIDELMLTLENALTKIPPPELFGAELLVRLHQLMLKDN